MKFLIEYESGKNNIAGLELRVIRTSRMIESDSLEDAMDKAWVTKFGNYIVRHFGHDPDYQKITNIKEI